jgi:hypothetical protein
MEEVGGLVPPIPFGFCSLISSIDVILKGQQLVMFRCSGGITVRVSKSRDVMMRS